MKKVALSKRNDLLPLHDAARSGDLDEINRLLEQGALVNDVTGVGKTPLHVATLQRQTEAARLLIDRGANVNAVDGDQETPLHISTRRRHIEGVRLLVERGANVDVHDHGGMTPLHMAARNRNMGIVRLIIDSGADVNATDHDGTTPLHIAARNGQVDAVRLLIERGANVDAANRHGSTPLHIAAIRDNFQVVGLLLDRSANIDMVREDGFTPLHVASGRGRIDIVRLLLERGANVNLLNANGHSPMDLASEQGHYNVVELLGISLFRAPPGWMPLHYAAANGLVTLAKHLVAKGESVIEQDANGKTPLEYAYDGVHIDLIQLLASSATVPIERLHIIAVNIFRECDNEKIDRLIANAELYHITLSPDDATENTLLLNELAAQYAPFNCYICRVDRIASKRFALPCGHQLCRDCESHVKRKSHGRKECGLCRGKY